MNGHSTTDNFTCDEEDCNFSCRTISVMQTHYRTVSSPNRPSYHEYEYIRGNYLPVVLL